MKKKFWSPWMYMPRLRYVRRGIRSQRFLQQLMQREMINSPMPLQDEFIQNKWRDVPVTPEDENYE